MDDDGLTAMFFGGEEGNDHFPEPKVVVVEDLKLLPAKPCLACGTFECFPKRESQDFPIRCSEDELLSHLCQFLKAPLAECGWGYEDEVPLCNECRCQLLRLVELKEKIVELERELEFFSSEFMRMCKQSENKLEESGIYRRDERYTKIRKLFKPGPLQETEESGGICMAPARRRKTIRSKNISAMAKWSPVVSISVEERTAAEESSFKVDEKSLIIKARKRIRRTQIKSQKSIKRQETVVATDASQSQRPKRNVKRRKSNLYEYEDNHNDADYIPPNQSDNKDMQDDNYDEYQSDSDVDDGIKVKKKMRNNSNIGMRNIKVERDPVTDGLKFMGTSFTNLGNDNYSCDVCGMEVKIKCNVGKTGITYCYKGLRNHVVKLHSDLFKCPHCDYRFHNRHILIEHIEGVHKGIKRNRKPVVCVICGKPLEKALLYRRHLWTHYSEEDKREAIARGEKVPQTKQRNYQCTECGKRYETPSALNTHTLSVHTDKDKISYELCPTCGKSVASFRMKAHTTRLHPSTTFTCQHCDKEFPNRATLRDHRYKEHEALPHKCEECGKRFRHKVNWVSHTNLHKGERPYPCPHCPMRFPAKNNIRKHIRRFHQEGSRQRFRALPTALNINKPSN